MNKTEIIITWWNEYTVTYIDNWNRIIKDFSWLSKVENRLNAFNFAIQVKWIVRNERIINLEPIKEEILEPKIEENGDISWLKDSKWEGKKKVEKPKTKAKAK